MSEIDVSLQAINKRKEKEIIKLRKRLDKLMAPILLHEVFKPESIFDYLERNMTLECQDFHVRADHNDSDGITFHISPDGQSGELCSYDQDNHDEYYSDLINKYSRAIQGVELTRPNDAKIEELAVKVADGSVLIPNIIIRQFKVKDDNSSSDDCKIIDEQRQFFDDLYLLLSKIIDIDPDLLPEQSSEGEEG
jgi:hypothetical protein